MASPYHSAKLGAMHQRLPKDLVDIAVSDPEKLDELEAQAEG